MPAVTSNALESTKPMIAEVDIFGVSHRGHVRATNADHFLVASFHRAMRVHASNMLEPGTVTLSPDSRGIVGLVADGVGSHARGEDGSAKTTEAAARFLLEMREISLQADPSRETEFLDRLRTLVRDAHQRLLAMAEEAGGAAATTFTMLLALWPRFFVVHAGDSRCYRLRDGVLEQLTTDHTMAQVMIDSGVAKPGSPEIARLRNVLLSAVGTGELDLQVLAYDARRSDRFLLCTDGLTRHVSDAEIREKLASDIGSERVCRALVDLALERGGEDNVTVLATRAFM